MEEGEIEKLQELLNLCKTTEMKQTQYNQDIDVRKLAICLRDYKAEGKTNYRGVILDSIREFTELEKLPEYLLELMKKLPKKDFDGTDFYIDDWSIGQYGFNLIENDFTISIRRKIHGFENLVEIHKSKFLWNRLKTYELVFVQDLIQTLNSYLNRQKENA